MVLERFHTRSTFETIAAQNPDWRIELINGEIIRKMPTQLHAYIVGIIAHFILTYLSENPIGYALVEARYGLPDDNENDRIPDLSFISKDKGPLVKEGPAPYMPDLAVEVQSPGQSDRLMIDKALYYLDHGSRMVWLVYPDRQLVEVFTVDERHLLTADATISGGDVLPGFTLAIQDIFPAEADQG